MVIEDGALQQLVEIMAQLPQYRVLRSLQGL